MCKNKKDMNKVMLIRSAGAKKFCKLVRAVREVLMEKVMFDEDLEVSGSEPGIIEGRAFRPQSMS